MTTIELIKDCAFFGGNMPNDRLQECREFFDNVIEKQLQEPILLSCKGRCDHGYNDELGNDLFCSTKQKQT